MKYKQLNQKNITFGMSPYNVLEEDDILNIDTSGWAITINLESITGVKRDLWINDINGTNPITISPSGLDTINWSASYVFQSADNTLYISSLSSGLWSVLTTDTPTPSSATTINNTLHVMKNGNNGTALPDRLDLPYLTIPAAITAAAAGDTIVVRPGTYLRSTDGQTNLKDGVNIQFIDGAILTNDTTSPYISDNGVAVTCILSNINMQYVTGIGSGTQAVTLTNAASNVRINGIRGDRIGLVATTLSNFFTLSDATLRVNNAFIINQNNFMVQTNGTFEFNGTAIGQSGHNQTFYTKNGGTLVWNGQITANSTSTSLVGLSYGGANTNNDDIFQGILGNLNTAAVCIQSVNSSTKLTLVWRASGLVNSWICTYVNVNGDVTSTNNLGGWSVWVTTGRATHNGNMFCSVLWYNSTGSNTWLLDITGGLYHTWVLASSHGISANPLSNITMSGKIVLTATAVGLWARAHNGTAANTPFKVWLVQSNATVSANTVIAVNLTWFIQSASVT